MNMNFTNQKLKFLVPQGCYVPKQCASARVARVEPVSRRRRYSRLTAHISAITLYHTSKREFENAPLPLSLGVL